MAKKTGGRAKGSKNRLTGSAETIGAALGSVAAKLDTWMAQRREIVNELNAVISRASGMLSSLEVPFPRRKSGRPAAADQPRASMPDTTMTTGAKTVKTGRKRKRRQMSKEARAKISAAQKARWAKQKKSKT